MSRALGFLLRNWPLKIGAIILAMLLYVGVVVAQGDRIWPGSIGISTVGAPADATLLEPLPEVSGIRYRAPLDVVSQLSSDSFIAQVDLSEVDPEAGGPPITVPVEVRALDQRVAVLDFSPPTVEVRLDPVTTREIPISVDYGSPPEGLVLGTPQVQPASVSLRGASTRLSTVRRVVARVTIDGSAVNVDAEVELVALDDQGSRVPGVEVTPGRARVQIAVDRQLATRSVPVVPDLQGTPPPGYRLEAVAVSPLVVTVSGSAPVVQRLGTVSTLPIDMTGRDGDFEQEIGLATPADVTILGSDRVIVRATIVPDDGSRTIAVGPQLVGARPDRQYHLSVETVQVTLAGPVPVLDQIDGQELRGEVTVDGLGVGTHPVTVEIEEPAGVEIVSIAPERIVVEVTVAAASPAAEQSPSS